MKQKPNILFFFADDQRFDTIQALGCSEISTPNLDRLTKRGISFTQAHIAGGTVSAVCMPSRAMLHSGRGLFHLQGCGEQIMRCWAKPCTGPVMKLSAPVNGITATLHLTVPFRTAGIFISEA